MESCTNKSGQHSTVASRQRCPKHRDKQRVEWSPALQASPAPPAVASSGLPLWSPDDPRAPALSSMHNVGRTVSPATMDRSWANTTFEGCDVTARPGEECELPGHTRWINCAFPPGVRIRTGVGTVIISDTAASQAVNNTAVQVYANAIVEGVHFGGTVAIEAGGAALDVSSGKEVHMYGGTARVVRRGETVPIVSTVYAKTQGGVVDASVDMVDGGVVYVASSAPKPRFGELTDTRNTAVVHPEYPLELAQARYLHSIGGEGSSTIAACNDAAWDFLVDSALIDATAPDTSALTEDVIALALALNPNP